MAGLCNPLRNLQHIIHISPLSPPGITRGTLQRLQGDLSKRAAMGGLLAAEAGWWGLELLLSGLAAQAAAGVRPELFGLMEVSGFLHNGMRGIWRAYAAFKGSLHHIATHAEAAAESQRRL